MNRQNRQARVELVRQYLETIRDETQRMVCFLFMRGCTPDDICRELKISHERLELVRQSVETEMRNFGLAPEDWREREENPKWI
ncbi:MAG: hypothetical protein MJ202_11190 [Lentisphaeria bacterium]|nr:hypothetical protein [Lentisphaeria bacterium]